MGSGLSREGTFLVDSLTGDDDALNDLPAFGKYVGLRNSGQAGYVAAVVQLLCGCEALRAHLVVEGMREDEGTVADLYDHVLALVGEMQRHPKRGGAVSIDRLVRYVQGDAVELDDAWESQDAYLFLRYLLTGVHEAAHRRGLYVRDARARKGKTTAVQALFGMRLRERYECVLCGAGGEERRRRVFTLSVETKAGCSLGQLLRQHAAVEDVLEAPCAECGGGEQRRVTRIEQPPHALIVHLRRRVGDARAPQHRVTAPVELKLGDLCADAAGDGERAYELRSVVLYSEAYDGGVAGEFSALRRVEHQWVRFHDAAVSPATYEHFSGSFGPYVDTKRRSRLIYMLLYEAFDAPRSLETVAAVRATEHGRDEAAGAGEGGPGDAS